MGKGAMYRKLIDVWSSLRTGFYNKSETISIRSRQIQMHQTDKILRLRWQYSCWSTLKLTIKVFVQALNAVTALWGWGLTRGNLHLQTGVRYRNVNLAWAKVEVWVDYFCPRTCKWSQLKLAHCEWLQICLRIKFKFVTSTAQRWRWRLPATM